MVAHVCLPNMLELKTNAADKLLLGGLRLLRRDQDELQQVGGTRDVCEENYSELEFQALSG